MEANQLGFRGRPVEYAETDTVIILLGDSNVEASACCAYGWMPERRLEHYLTTKYAKKVKVFTIGASGYGTDQELLALREYYERYRADVVILWQTPANDIWNNLFPTHMPGNGTRKPTFSLVDGQLQWPAEKIGQEIRPPAFRIGALLKARISPILPDQEWEQHLPAPYNGSSSYDGRADQTWEQLRVQGLLKDENLRSEKSHFAMNLTPVSPRMQYALDLTQALLREVEKEVLSRKGTFAIFRPLYNDSLLVKDQEEVFEFDGRFYRASRRQREANMAYINKGFDEYHVPLLLKDHRVGPWDGHLNEHATDEVMEALAGRLASSIPMERSAR